MSHIPVKNQGNIGICYAETAAQLIDAFRFSHGDTHFDALTSGLQAALSLGESQRRKMIDGGQVCVAFEHIQQYGSCDVRAVLDSKKISRKAFIDRVTKIHFGYHDYLRKSGLSTEWHSSSNFMSEDSFDLSGYKQNRILKEALRDLTNLLLKSGLPRHLIPSERDMEYYLNERNVMHLLQGVLSPSCKGFTSKPKYNTRGLPKCLEANVTSLGPERLMSLIYSQLQGPIPQPVSVSYCGAVLKKGKGYRGIVYLPRMKMCAGVRNGGWHASLVIGKRRDPKTGNIQVRIRNSWGDSCFARNKPMYSKDWECDRGNIWVDADTFKYSLAKIGYLAEP